MAAAAGKHIFCEKPVGIEPPATAAIEFAARTAGVITGCGFNYRWAPSVQYAKRLIEEGRFGGLTHYRGRFFSMYGRDRLGLLSWRFLQDDAGYGALTDLMSHAVDMALHLAGPIRRVVSTKNIFVAERPLPTPGSGSHYDRGSPGDPAGEVTNEDYVGALVEFDSGAPRHARGGPVDLRPTELNGLRGERLPGRRVLGQREAQPAQAVPARGTAGGRIHRGARRRYPVASRQHRPRWGKFARLRGHEADRSLGIPEGGWRETRISSGIRRRAGRRRSACGNDPILGIRRMGGTSSAYESTEGEPCWKTL